MKVSQYYTKKLSKFWGNRSGVLGANFYKWRDKFIESGKTGFYGAGRSGDNEYQKE